MKIGLVLAGGGGKGAYELGVWKALKQLNLQLSPGIYNFEVLFASSDVTAKYIKNITLVGGKFYTIYILGVFNGKPVIGYLLTEDLI